MQWRCTKVKVGPCSGTFGSAPARGQVTWNNHAGRMLAFQQQVRDQTNSVVAAHVIAPAGAGGVSKAGGGMRQRKSSAPLRSLF